MRTGCVHRRGLHAVHELRGVDAVLLGCGRRTGEAGYQVSVLV